MSSAHIWKAMRMVSDSLRAGILCLWSCTMGFHGCWGKAQAARLHSVDGSQQSLNRNTQDIPSVSTESWNGPDRNVQSQLTSSFTLRALMSLCPLSSSQPSYHRSTMWHLILWASHPPWSPKHLKLVTIYMLVLLVSLSFASRQSRPFKHQIDNRSKYNSHLMQCDGDPVAPGYKGSGSGFQAEFNCKSLQVFLW